MTTPCRLMSKMLPPAQPDDDEREVLRALQPSWADCATQLLTLGGTRISRRGNRLRVLCRSLPEVNALLDGYRRRFEDEGDRLACWSALSTCAEENLPLPYWLADFVIQAGDEIVKVPNDDDPPSNLHTLFGLEERWPASGKRAVARRISADKSVRLYARASEIMRGSGKSGNKVKSILQAVQEMGLGLSKTVAVQMFDEQDRIQERHLNTLNRRRLRRIR